MNNVIINGFESNTVEYPVKLNNGDLLLWMDANSKVTEAFLITSYRNNKDNPYWKTTSTYCSFISLDNGTIFFEEPCSRNTTNLRVLSHLNRWQSHYGNSIQFKNTAGEQLKVIRRGNYNFNININIKQEEN
jgi:hypothetical protein